MKRTVVVPDLQVPYHDPVAASDRTATKNALAHEPAAVLRSFIICS